MTKATRYRYLNQSFMLHIPYIDCTLLTVLTRVTSCIAAYGSAGFPVIPHDMSNPAVSQNNLRHTTACTGSWLQPAVQLPYMRSYRDRHSNICECNASLLQLFDTNLQYITFHIIQRQGHRPERVRHDLVLPCHQLISVIYDLVKFALWTHRYVNTALVCQFYIVFKRGSQHSLCMNVQETAQLRGGGTPQTPRVKSHHLHEHAN